MPKHRGAPVEPAAKKVLTRGALLSGVAVVTTVAAVTAGVALSGAPGPEADPAIAALADATPTAEVDLDLADRATPASRSDRRTAVDETKAQALSQDSGGQVTRTEDLASGDPRDIARAMLPEFGFASSQFGCLDSLWTRESNWNPRAANPTSSAYGIPQSLPGSKMASAGPDWRYNPETQIRWGLGYIRDRYGSPCGAWGHSQRVGWY